MLSPSVFISSIFSKYEVRDKKVRAHIIEIYTSLIESILLEVPAQRHVLVFKELLPGIHATIVLLQSLRAAKAEITPELISSLNSLSAFSKYVIKNPSPRGSEAFDAIMRQVNLDDIACDMGECISRLKSMPPDDPAREGVASQLEVLLHGYNGVTGSRLTIEGILNGESSSEL